jgi:hypothetical protein
MKSAFYSLQADSCLEDGGDIFLQNINQFPLKYMVLRHCSDYGGTMSKCKLPPTDEELLKNVLVDCSNLTCGQCV